MTLMRTNLHVYTIEEAPEDAGYVVRNPRGICYGLFALLGDAEAERDHLEEHRSDEEDDDDE